MKAILAGTSKLNTPTFYCLEVERMVIVVASALA